MKTLKLILVGVTALTLSACAFDKNAGADDKRESEDNAYLRDKYSQVAGRYHGLVQGNPSEEIDLTLYPVQVPNGKNSRGETTFTYQLRAQYHWTDRVRDDLILEARYFYSGVPQTLSVSNFSSAATN
ncbi:MAG: hypothetical protein EOP06_11030, partial [Proteobacteria bacterium]